MVGDSQPSRGLNLMWLKGSPRGSYEKKKKKQIGVDLKLKGVVELDLPVKPERPQDNHLKGRIADNV